MSAPLVGVLGATGAVGATAVARLAAGGRVRLRLGARTATTVHRLAAQVGAEPVPLDLDDGAALERFCAGCAVVVQCAGPSLRVATAVAPVAARVGAHLVDAGGDPDRLPAGDRAVVLGAGVVPGLSGLLPRLLPRGARRLDLYVGGADRLTATSAADVLLAAGPRFGVPGAVWRDGSVVPGALAPLSDVALPGFAGPVRAVPVLTPEAQRLAADLDATELRAHTVFPSARLPDALATAWASDDPLAHIEAVVSAAATDVAERGAGITVLASARYADGARRVLLRTADSLALTGATAALAAEFVLAGTIPVGVHRTAEVLDAAACAERLAADPAVTELVRP